MTDKLPAKSRKQPSGGSRKGIPNKNTAAIKDMVLNALEGVGGESYLMERAQDPKTAGAFLTLVGKVLPLQVHGAGPNGEHVFQRIVREIVKPK